jgi:hypothetical protein
MTQKQGFGRRVLSLLEGPVENMKTWAKSYDRPAGLDLTADPTRSWKAMRGLRNIYLQGAYISEGVDLYPLYAIGAGYELESDDETAKKVIDEFLTRINFYDTTWQMLVDAETVRDGIAEIVFGKGSMAKVPVNIVPRPAECFEFVTDARGVITEYRQKWDYHGNALTVPVSMPPASILHYQFLSRPDSPYGISIVERCIHDIKRDTQVIEAVTAGILLHGTPKWHIQVNSRQPERPNLSADERRDVENEFKDFNAKDQFITQGDILVEAKDIAGLPNIQQYSDVVMARVISGLGVPGELLGLRQGTTDATAVTRVGAFFRKIKSCQRDVEQMWGGIFDRILQKPGLVKLKLRPVTFAELMEQAGYIEKISKISPTDPFAVMSRRQMQVRLEIDPDEWEADEGEDIPVPTMTGPVPPQFPPQQPLQGGEP